MSDHAARWSEHPVSTIEGNPPQSPVDRQLPQIVDAEKAVLGSILLLPEVFDEVALLSVPGLLRRRQSHVSSSTAADARRWASRSIRCCWSKDSATQGNTSRSAAQPIWPSWDGWFHRGPCRVLRPHRLRQGVLRSLIHAGTDILHDAYDPTSDTREMLSKAEERIFGILESRGSRRSEPHQRRLAESHGSARRADGPRTTPSAVWKRASTTTTNSPVVCRIRN